MVDDTKRSETILEKYEKTLEQEAKTQNEPRKEKLSKTNLMLFSYFHVAGLYGLHLALTEARWYTLLLAFVLREAGMLGITAGAHRLWSHRTYKAKLPLQIILMLLQSMACQTSVIHWSQDHRLHHKYTDTDADPHNSNRGFFFSHIGWLFVKKNPEARRRKRSLDASDLFKNPVLRFQKKFALPIIAIVCFIMPTVIPVYFWGETLHVAWHVNILRVLIALHITFLVNSAAHAFGNKPYDQFISPTQNTPVSVATLGEAYHNYHHVFPWDYRAAELGNNALNLTTLFIDFCAWIGWAYDMKAASGEVILRRKQKTGDGTNLWGWGDKDMPKEYKEGTKVLWEKKKESASESKNFT